MARLAFPIAGVRTLCDHALAAPQHDRGYGDESPPRAQLILVKDEGIYLMSNGRPRLMADQSLGDDTSDQPNFVVYARGFDPNQRDRNDVWHAARDAAGGDDFSEYFDFATLHHAIRQPDAAWLVIELDADSMAISVMPEKRKSPQTPRGC